MIWIKVEMWPGGLAESARTLFEAIIHNTGGTQSSGSYEWIVSRKGGFKTEVDRLRRADVRNVLRRGIIEGFPRLRLGAADLLFRCLREGFGDRNK